MLTGIASPWKQLFRPHPSSYHPRTSPISLDSKRRYLSAIDIFQNLSQEEIEELMNLTPVVSCRKGQLIFSPGETGEALFLLKKGRVQLYKLSEEGKKLIIGVLEPGTIFGEMALLAQGMQDSYAEATEEGLICAMSRPDVEQLFLEKPKIALRALEVISSRLGEAYKWMEEASFKRVPGRVASLLLRLARGRPLMVEGYSHQDLADMVGALRETVTEVVDQFQKTGLVEIERKRITVRDSRRLREIAEG